MTSDHGAVFSSGGLFTPPLLQELTGNPAKGELAPGSFTDLDVKSLGDVDQAVETGFVMLGQLYDEVRPVLDSLDRPELQKRWVLPLLRHLGWQPSYQRAALRASHDDPATFPINHLGWPDDAMAPPLHIAASAGSDIGLDARESPKAPSPHDLVQRFLNHAPQDWGIVTDGRELRVLRDYHHTTTKGFLAFDLEAIFEERDFPGFRALFRAAHVSRFRPPLDDPNGAVPLEAMYRRSQAAGVSVGKALQVQVRKVIEILARGVVDGDPELRTRFTDPTEARAFYGEVLRVVYRLLFLLFAEQRGLLPGRDTLYAETYSATRLRELTDRLSEVEARRGDLYEGLKVTFRLMSKGSEALGIKPFNGHLFDELETPTMSGATVNNRELLLAIRELTNVSVDGKRQHVAFSSIGVEELGAVYERLLDHTPRIATELTVSDTGEVVPVGSLYLDLVGDRELGSYYTPRDLVAFTLEQSLDPLIEERLASLSTAEEREVALLALRCIDPACGSGAFLVSVIDRIAVRLAEVRLDGSQPTEHQLSLARRDVLQHCIYGVDVDPFAVELCKVALWIHCAVSDLPLTFLDHRIQHGNSLIGWPLRDIPADIPFDAYQTQGKTKGDEETKTICQSARERNKKALEGQGDLFATAVARPDVRLDYPPLWEEEERTPADVDKKLATYRDYLESLPYRLWKATADLWVSSFFWTADFGDQAPISTDYWHARTIAEGYRDGTLSEAEAIRHLDTSLVRSAGRIAGDLAVFHWAIRFPEIAERGGFDLVTGNPPWEVVKLQEERWFGTRDQSISLAPSAVRRELIASLDETNPDLAAAWRLASSAIARQADFMRFSTRYARSGTEPNTYRLFTETNVNNTRDAGRAGFIVKSSLGIDLSGQSTFQPLVSSGRVHGYYDIVNGGRGQSTIFEGVAEVERFAVLAIGPAQPSPMLAVSLMNWSVDEARERPRIIASAVDLRTMNPVSKSLPSFRSQLTWDVGLRMHQSHDTLDFDRPTADELVAGRPPASNPWGLHHTTLFHSKGDSALFLRREALEQEGWVLGDDMVFRGGSGTAVPLYEGQLMNRYDHRARTYAGYPTTKKYGRKPGIPLADPSQKRDPAFEIEPRYWLRDDVAESRLCETIGQSALVGFRNVGAVWTNQRSARAALLPRRPATHGLPVFGIAKSVVFEFIALFNSTPFDFLVRGKMPGGNLAVVWMLSQTAAPGPGLSPTIAANARKLSITSSSIAAEFGVEPHPWDPEERYVLDVETDALVAHAYGVTAAEYEVMLDTFDVLARQEIKEHGRYRFKDDCLAAYRRVD